MLLIEPDGRKRVATGTRTSTLTTTECAALALGFAAALAVRLVGVRGGLPFPLNVDEVANYAWRVPGLSERAFDPVGLMNPSAYTYLSWGAVSLFGGIPRGGVRQAFASDPASVLLGARLVSAVTGAALVPAVWAAARLAFGRVAGLIAIPLATFAFLPVVYSHMSVNDSMATTLVAVALAASHAGLRDPRPAWFVLAGAAAGIAGGTKYSAAVALAGVAVAALCTAPRQGRLRALGLVGIAALAAAIGFVIVNPYSVIDPQRFIGALGAQQAAIALGWKGGLHSSPVSFYPWSVGWGLGLVPSLAAVLGLVLGLARSTRATLVTATPAALIALTCMTSPTFFARYALPAYPALMVLAAGGAALPVLALGQRFRGALLPAAVTAAVALAAAGAVHSTHFDRIWLREGTMTTAAKWVEGNIPHGSRIIADRYMAPWWPTGRLDGLYRLWPDARADAAAPLGAAGLSRLVSDRRRGGLAARDASPRLLDVAERDRWCWIITSSFQAGRAVNDPVRFARAAGYYSALEGPRATLMFRVSPWADPVSGPPQVGARPFDFDWSYNSYPLDSVRSGPLISIYWLDRCGTPPRPPARI